MIPLTTLVGDQDNIKILKRVSAICSAVIVSWAIGEVFLRHYLGSHLLYATLINILFFRC